MSIPESRIEAILSDILGYLVDLEHPKSRVEELLVALGALVGNTPQLDNEGLIPISYLPPVAFADCITVADQTARFALTTDDVQNGDTVYQNDTQVMYFVVDDTKLDQAAGYKALAAGIAAQAVADKNGNDITTTYQTIIDSQHKISADNVDDSQSNNKFVNSNEKTLIGGIDNIKYDTAIPSNVSCKPSKPSTTWRPISFSNAPSDLDGSRIWTDGDSIFYSYNAIQKVFDKKTKSWSNAPWTTSTIYGENVWTDGDNIYHSYNGSNNVLDRSTYYRSASWSQRIWNGLTNFDGRNVWTDGDNIYYSSTLNHYVLNRSTSTWSQKTWNGLTNFNGEEIWTDGDNIYYSSGTSYQYVLDKSTSTWSQKTWNGFTNFNGRAIWTDGKYIHYDWNTEHYILDKITSTWIPVTWTGLTSFIGSQIWTDGDNIYRSYYGSNYILNKVSTRTEFNNHDADDTRSDWNEYNSFSPSFIKNKPTLGTAASLNVPTSGNASTSQVVKGDDSRLTDSRNPLSHNQASDTINAMTGYTVAQTASAINASDSLNTAIGKLEKGVGDVNSTIGDINSVLEEVL